MLFWILELYLERIGLAASCGAQVEDFQFEKATPKTLSGVMNLYLAINMRKLENKDRTIRDTLISAKFQNDRDEAAKGCSCILLH